MGDGRNYSLVTDKKYDVISVDATSPKCAGNGSLYALEFFQLCKNSLTKDGIVAQWLPLHLLSDEEVRMTAKTFKTVFPHTTLWFTPVRLYCVLIGTQEKLEIDFESLSSKLEMENVRQELETVDVTNPIDFLSGFVMGEEALDRYIGDARINTDDHPYLEFTPSMAYFTRTGYQVQNMRNVSELRESVFPLLINKGESDEEVARVRDKLQQRFEATKYSISGEIFVVQGMMEKAIDEYQKALLIDSEDKLTVRFLDSAKDELKLSYLNRGLIYYVNNMYNEAKIEFKKAIAIDPDFVAAHFNMAICYMNEGMYREAKAEQAEV